MLGQIKRRAREKKRGERRIAVVRIRKNERTGGGEREREREEIVDTTAISKEREERIVRWHTHTARHFNAVFSDVFSF